jgi:hypothetical protein
MWTLSHSGDFDCILTLWFDWISNIRAGIYLLAKEMLILSRRSGIFLQNAATSSAHNQLVAALGEGCVIMNSGLERNYQWSETRLSRTENFCPEQRLS